MKRKDLIIIIGVAVVSAIFSYVIAGYIFGGEKSETLKAPVVQPISAEFPETEEYFFNANSINPTQEITIGDETNDQPF